MPGQRQRVLVTGASGFVGSHVVRRLLAAPDEWEVHALARSAAAGATVAALSPDITLHEGDMCDAASLAAALAACTPSVVVNCAALYRWWHPRPADYAAVNQEAVGHLMRAVAEAGVAKVVQVSTILAFGSSPGYGTEAAPLTPDLQPGQAASRYAASKAAGDTLALALGAQLGLGACVVQLACVVGRDPKLLRPQDDVMRMLPLVRGEVPATIAGDTVYTYVDVGDAAEAIVRAAERGRPGRRYFIGNQRLTTGEYYGLLSELSGQPAPRASAPLWVARLWAQLSAAWSASVSGVAPTAPPDLINTVAFGTLLFDSSSSDAELGGLTYRPIRESFADAVAWMLQQHPAPGAAAPGAAASQAPRQRAHVAQPWFGLVADGSKEVEGRLAAGAWAGLRPGDRLAFHNEAALHDLHMTVLSLAKYPSFEAMLVSEGLARVLPPASGVASLEQGVAVYRAFYSAEQEAQHGVLALRVRPCSADS